MQVAATAGVEPEKALPRSSGKAFTQVMWFVAAVLIALMFLPHETVMWGLIAAAAGMVLFRWKDIAK